MKNMTQFAVPTHVKDLPERRETWKSKEDSHSSEKEGK